MSFPFPLLIFRCFSPYHHEKSKYGKRMGIKRKHPEIHHFFGGVVPLSFPKIFQPKYRAPKLTAVSLKMDAWETSLCFFKALGLFFISFCREGRCLRYPSFHLVSVNPYALDPQSGSGDFTTDRFSIQHLGSDLQGWGGFSCSYGRAEMFAKRHHLKNWTWPWHWLYVYIYIEWRNVECFRYVSDLAWILFNLWTWLEQQNMFTEILIVGYMTGRYHM